MAKTVVALIDSPARAEQVIDQLASECGMNRSRIRLIVLGAEEDADSALANLGVPEDDADYYTEGLRSGGALIAVPVTDREAELAADVICRHIGHDARAEVQAGQDQDVLPVVNEELAVGKRKVSRGGVRLYTRVTQSPVEEKVQLREERASIERRPTDRALAAGEDAFKEITIEVRETAEEAVVEKRRRVTEEIVVNKEVSEREETIRDTVRTTDVRIEQLDASGAPTSYGGPERRLSSAPYSGLERRAR
ncbi:MAG: YsnF/AvaK domain-containing protein [Burkholderiales bacterium]